MKRGKKDSYTTWSLVWRLGWRLGLSALLAWIFVEFVGKALGQPAAQWFLVFVVISEFVIALADEIGSER